MDHDDGEMVQDELDDVEFGEGDNEAKATELECRAVRSPAGSPRWAEFLAVAADHRSIIGQHDRAIELLREVRGSGAVVEPSADARLLAAYVVAGRDPDWAPLEADLRRRSREVDLGEDYAWVGQSFEEAGHLRYALRWFNMANRDIEPEDLRALDMLAVDGHYRVRRELGLPEDAYDRAALALR